LRNLRFQRGNGRAPRQLDSPGDEVLSLPTEFRAIRRGQRLDRLHLLIEHRHEGVLRGAAADESVQLRDGRVEDETRRYHAALLERARIGDRLIHERCNLRQRGQVVFAVALRRERWNCVKSRTSIMFAPWN